jgi:hypothetical protein
MREAEVESVLMEERLFIPCSEEEEEEEEEEEALSLSALLYEYEGSCAFLLLS